MGLLEVLVLPFLMQLWRYGRLHAGWFRYTRSSHRRQDIDSKHSGRTEH